MAPTLADTVLRFPPVSPKTGLIPPSLRSRRAEATEAGVTALRLVPVGRPTFHIFRPRRPRLKDPLVATAIATAFESLDMLDRRAQEVVGECRAGHVPEARSALADLVNGLRALVDLADTAADIQGLDLEELGGDAGSRASNVMRAVTNSLIAHQMTGDWRAVGRCIECRFTDALALWRTVVEHLHDLTAGTNPDGHAA
jgi:hypothetical protein